MAILSYEALQRRFESKPDLRDVLDTAYYWRTRPEPNKRQVSGKMQIDQPNTAKVVAGASNSTTPPAGATTIVNQTTTIAASLPLNHVAIGDGEGNPLKSTPRFTTVPDGEKVHVKIDDDILLGGDIKTGQDGFTIRQAGTDTVIFGANIVNIRRTLQIGADPTEDAGGEGYDTVIWGDTFLKNSSLKPELPLFKSATDGLLYGRRLEETDSPWTRGASVAATTIMIGDPVAATGQDFGVLAMNTALAATPARSWMLGVSAEGGYPGEISGFVRRGPVEFDTQAFTGAAGSTLWLQPAGGLNTTKPPVSNATRNVIAGTLLVKAEAGKIYVDPVNFPFVHELSGVNAAAPTDKQALMFSTATNRWEARAVVAADVSGVEPSITAGTTAQYWRGDKSWQTLNTTAVAEGTNLYYTDARARAAISATSPIAYSAGVISHLAGDGQLHVPATSTTNNGKFLKAGATAGSIAWAALTYSDLTGTVPTWNQSTTGSAATLTTARTLTIGSTGKTFNGSANVSWSLAEIGAAPAHSVGTNVVLKSNGSGGFAASTASDNGALFVTTGRLGWDGGTLRDLVGDSGKTALYGVLVPETASNYGLAVSKNGSEAWLNGSYASVLAASGVVVALATSSGLAITGALSVSGTTTLSALGAGVVRSSAGGVLSSSALTYADITGTVPTWNQNTTGSAATLTTPRTLTIGTTGKAFNGSANVSWSLAEIGAQAAGTYLTPSNVSGTSGQIAAFTGPNTVGGDAGFTRGKTSSVTTSIIVGDGAVAAAPVFSLSSAVGQESQSWNAQGGKIRWKKTVSSDGNTWSLQAFSTAGTFGTLIDNPISVANAAGGTVSLGGNGRPINLTSGSKLQINGTDAITSARIGKFTGADLSGELTFTADGLGLSTFDGGRIYKKSGTGLVLRQSTGNQTPQIENSAGTILGSILHSGNLTTQTIPGLAGTGNRLLTATAGGAIGTTSWANDGPWLPLTGMKNVTGYINMFADLYMNTGTSIKAPGWYTEDFGIFPTGGSFSFAGGATVAFSGSITVDKKIILPAAGAEASNVAPSGFSRVTVTTSGTTLLPAPEAGLILIVQRTGTAPSSYYVKPANGHTVSYVDLGGVARIMNNSATNGLTLGAAGGSLMFIGVSSAEWSLIGAWPQGF